MTRHPRSHFNVIIETTRSYLVAQGRSFRSAGMMTYEIITGQDRGISYCSAILMQARSARFRERRGYAPSSVTRGGVHSCEVAIVTLPGSRATFRTRPGSRRLVGGDIREERCPALNVITGR